MSTKKVLVKIGTNILTTPSGKLDLNNLRQLINQISIAHQNYQVIVVTSGAITCGAELLNTTLHTIPEKQAAASVGQILLMAEYTTFFKNNGIPVGQLLLTKDGLQDKNRQFHTLNTISKLLDFNCIPIINENDSVATNEIKFGDNDELSSLVAVLCNVDHYIILSDVDGLYTKNPLREEDASLIPEVDKVDEHIRSIATGPIHEKSKGGMLSKVNAADYAASNNIVVTIANGRQSNIIQDILNGFPVGTTFNPLK